VPLLPTVGGRLRLPPEKPADNHLPHAEPSHHGRVP